MRSLAARHRFWDGVHYQVVNWRQPTVSRRLGDDEGQPSGWFSRLLGGDQAKLGMRRPQVRALAERLRPGSWQA